MEEKHVVLKTRLGSLKGQTRSSRLSQKTFYSFQGIPYAKPPLKELRFKAPQAFGSWEGVRDATKDGNCPIQPPKITPWPGLDLSQVSIGDEDCLYLNVYINQLPETSGLKKPVMVYIHGGGFQGGEGGFNLYGPDYIMNEEVVMVSINYRCGAFGFLSLENEDVPGNMGLRDQRLALQWVKDNIDSFGGDPNNVTIFGVSAGGATVHYHMLSKTSKGLFHKAIMQSGFANGSWALQSEPRKTALRLAKSLGCTSENNDEILRFLQSVPAVDIVAATSKLVTDKRELWYTVNLIFTPCIEVAGENPFLTDTPDNLMAKGEVYDVPVILGCTVDEGSVCTYLIEPKEEDLKSLPNTPELLVPPFLELKHGSNEEKKAAKDIWEFYFKENPYDFEKFQSDIHFNWGMAKTKRYLLTTNSSPVYTYLFTNNSLLEAILGKEGKDKEAGHGADLAFLAVFGLFPSLEITPDYKEAIVKHVKAWTTFATVGDPNCKELGEVWEKDVKYKPCYMDIGTTWKMRRGVPFADRVGFWNRMYATYNPSS